MKKESMRLVSAVLAVCMAAAAFPAGALALDAGAQPESSVSTQAETPLLADGTVLQSGGSYRLSGSYTQGVVLDTTGEVNLTIDGDVYGPTAENTGFFLIQVQKPCRLNMNGGSNTVHLENAKQGVFLHVAGTAANAEVHVTSGTYQGGIVTFGLDGGTVYLDNVTVADARSSLIQNNGADITITGGVYRVGSGNWAIHNLSGTIRLKDAEVSSNIRCPMIKSEAGELIFDSGKYSAGAENCIEVAGGKLTINGGTYSVDTRGVDFGNSQTMTLRIGPDAEAEIHGGTFIHAGAPEQVIYNCGKLTVDEEQGPVLIEGRIESNPDGLYFAALASGGADGDPGELHFKAGTIDAPDMNGISLTSGMTGTSEISGGTIKNTRRGVWLGDAKNALKDVTFENNDVDIFVTKDTPATIADTFTKRATIEVWNFSGNEHCQITTSNEDTLNLVSKNEGYRVVYDEAGHHYDLQKRTPGKYVLKADDAKAALEDGTELENNAEVAKDARVNLTAVDGKTLLGWELEVDGVLRNDLLQGTDTDSPWFIMPEGDVTVRARYSTGADDTGTDAPAADTGSTDGSIGGAIAAGIVTGTAAWGVYEAGTGIYRMVNMKGIPMPANRGELAMLIWEHAGKPEPASTALYADIDADNADLQKAAHWMVEQDLMDEKADNNFKPNTHVTKLRVCATWEKAKQKGLLD